MRCDSSVLTNLHLHRVVGTIGKKDVRELSVCVCDMSVCDVSMSV